MAIPSFLYGYIIGLLICAVGWADCRIHKLHLNRGAMLLPNDFSGYKTKQSNGEVAVIF